MKGIMLSKRSSIVLSFLALFAAMVLAVMVTASLNTVKADGASGSGSADTGSECGVGGAGACISAHAVWQLGDWGSGDEAVQHTIDSGYVQSWTATGRAAAATAYQNALQSCKDQFGGDCKNPRVVAIGYWKLANSTVNNAAGVTWMNYAEAWAGQDGYLENVADAEANQDHYADMFDTTHAWDVQGKQLQSNVEIGTDAAPSVNDRIKDNSYTGDTTGINYTDTTTVVMVVVDGDQVDHTEDFQPTPSHELKLTKVDADNHAIKLNGAKFNIRSCKLNPDYKSDDGDDYDSYKWLCEYASSVNDMSNQQYATMEGQINLPTAKNTKYLVSEIKAPSSYEGFMNGFKTTNGEYLHSEEWFAAHPNYKNKSFFYDVDATGHISCTDLSQAGLVVSCSDDNITFADRKTDFKFTKTDKDGNPQKDVVITSQKGEWLSGSLSSASEITSSTFDAGNDGLGLETKTTNAIKTGADGIVDPTPYGGYMIYGGLNYKGWAFSIDDSAESTYAFCDRGSVSDPQYYGLSDKCSAVLKIKIDAYGHKTASVEGAAKITGDPNDGSLKLMDLPGKKIRKVDAKTGEPLAGAEFKLYECDDVYPCTAKGKTEGMTGTPALIATDITADPENTFLTKDTTIDHLTSDANGYVHLPQLPDGQYILQETKFPEGYANPYNGRTYNEADGKDYMDNPGSGFVGVKITAKSGEQTIEDFSDAGLLDGLTLKNVKPEITIKKIDANTSKPMSGVKFTLGICDTIANYAGGSCGDEQDNSSYLDAYKTTLLDGKKQMDVTTDNNGLIKITSNLVPNRYYRLSESTPTGYRKDSGPVIFKVDADGKISWDPSAYQYHSAWKTDTDLDSDTNTITRKNTHVSSWLLKKVGTDDASKGLAGAVFTLGVKDYPRRYTSDVTTDASGEVNFSKLSRAEWVPLYFAKYYNASLTITEKTAPAGYKKSSQTLTMKVTKFETDADDKITDIDLAPSGNVPSDFTVDTKTMTITVTDQKLNDNVGFLKKVDAGDSKTVLKNATFQLGVVYDGNCNTSTVEGDKTIELITDDNGLIDLKKAITDPAFPDKTCTTDGERVPYEKHFYLKETKAPANYYELNANKTQDKDGYDYDYDRIYFTFNPEDNTISDGGDSAGYNDFYHEVKDGLNYDQSTSDYYEFKDGNLIAKDKKKTITVNKTDVKSGAPLSGAVFTLKGADSQGATNSNYQFSKEYTTNADGRVEIDLTKVGADFTGMGDTDTHTYILTETEAPEDYSLNDAVGSTRFELYKDGHFTAYTSTGDKTTYPVGLAHFDDKTNFFNIKEIEIAYGWSGGEASRIGYIPFYKVDGSKLDSSFYDSDYTPLTGSEWKLQTTDKDGNPTGECSADFKADDLHAYDYANDKQDDDFADVTGEFGIPNTCNKELMPEFNDKGELVKAKYFSLTETKAPAGYKVLPEPIVLSTSSDDHLTYKVMKGQQFVSSRVDCGIKPGSLGWCGGAVYIGNFKDYSNFKIKKVDADDHSKVLKGAVFTAHNKSDYDESVSVTTGDDGIADFSGKLKLDTTYRLNEDTAPDGYQTGYLGYNIYLKIDATGKASFVDYDGNPVTGDLNTASNGRSWVSWDENTATATVQDSQFMARFDFYKVDGASLDKIPFETDTNGKPTANAATMLEGSEWDLKSVLDKDGKAWTGYSEHLTPSSSTCQSPMDGSDKPGCYSAGYDRTTGMYKLPYGTYTLTETKAPAGYDLPAKATVKLKVDAKGATILDQNDLGAKFAVKDWGNGYTSTYLNIPNYQNTVQKLIETMPRTGALGAVLVVASAIMVLLSLAKVTIELNKRR